MDDITLNVLNLLSNLVINTFYYLKGCLIYYVCGQLPFNILFNISLPSGLLELPIVTQVAVGNTWGETHLDI